MSITLVLLLTAISARPVPSDAEVSKADSQIAAVFGDDLAAAVTPAAHAAIAKKLLKTGQESGGDDGSRWACYAAAKNEALAAEDMPLVLEVLAAKSGDFEPVTDVKAVVEDGNRLWDEASGKRGEEATKLKLAAAEKYLAVRERVEGIEKVLVEKRLGELAEVSSESRLQPITLRAKEAVPHRVSGDARYIRVEREKIVCWCDARDWISWDTVLPAGTYKVELNLSCQDADQGSAYSVVLRNIKGKRILSQLDGTVDGTGGWDKQKEIAIGIIHISRQTNVSVGIVAKSKPGWGVMDLKWLRLVPSPP